MTPAERVAMRNRELAEHDAANERWLTGHAKQREAILANLAEAEKEAAKKTRGEELAEKALQLDQFESSELVFWGPNGLGKSFKVDSPQQELGGYRDLFALHIDTERATAQREQREACKEAVRSCMARNYGGPSEQLISRFDAMQAVLNAVPSEQSNPNTTGS